MDVRKCSVRPQGSATKWGSSRVEKRIKALKSERKRSSERDEQKRALCTGLVQCCSRDPESSWAARSESLPHCTLDSAQSHWHSLVPGQWQTLRGKSLERRTHGNPCRPTLSLEEFKENDLISLTLPLVLCCNILCIFSLGFLLTVKINREICDRSDHYLRQVPLQLFVAWSKSHSRYNKRNITLLRVRLLKGDKTLCP